ncbi:MAG: pantoate--beta-alanine ligase [Actinomycetota bacterium]|nr:pantoate--beta-alanine ligase [Actinomycetota bacterium]
MTTAPVLAPSREELVGALEGIRAEAQRVALVPTMGALHPGHAALVNRARTEVGDGPVVVSIFVNPLQFGPAEDLERYPRSLEADLELCAGAGADLVFAPSVEEMYPAGSPRVTIDPGPLGEILEGDSRPGHFRGVLTVVAKLFGLVRPDVSVFGEKDYQQLVLVRRMAWDLCLGVEVVGAETVRHDDGLAMSSRNAYLDADQRRAATVLAGSLAAARAQGHEGADAALAVARDELQQAAGLELDYLALTCPELGPAPAVGDARMLVAARFGKTRLIDNMALELGRT